MNRPAIPTDVKRELRRESGFGCCICGHPFIQYHHIVPWHEDKHFRPEDMMALCPNHHYECTVEAISPEDQRYHKLNSANMSNGLSKGNLKYNLKGLEVKLGGGLAINTPNLLVLGGEVVLALRLDQEDEQLLVYAKIHDIFGNVVGHVAANEWQIPPSRAWDLEAVPRRVKVHSHPRNLSLEVDARGDCLEINGNWYYGRRKIKFSKDEIDLDGASMKQCTVSHCLNYIVLN